MDSTGFEPVAFTFQTEGSAFASRGDLRSPLLHRVSARILMIIVLTNNSLSVDDNENMTMDSTGFEPVAFTFQTEGSAFASRGDLRSPLLQRVSARTLMIRVLTNNSLSVDDNENMMMDSTGFEPVAFTLQT
jgi:hypothetical protein